MPSPESTDPVYLQQLDQHFGLCPDFFRTASSPDCAEALWSMAKYAYIDAPFPSLFKEKLFVFLSRFCRSSYCFSRHAAFLTGRGAPAGDPECNRLTPDAISQLLKLSLPQPDELAAMLSGLASGAIGDDEWEPAQEPTLIILASISFRRQIGCEAIENALLGYFGAVRYDRFALFLNCIRSAHYWTETHPNLRPEPDVAEWLQGEPELAAWIASNFPDNVPPSAGASKPCHVEAPQFQAPPMPENESDRLTALRQTGLLDTDSEPAYDDLARLAKGICGTPIALISLVDAERQWFKAKIGIDAAETSRDISFCGHAICRPDEVMVVPDATLDERFKGNPLVTGEPNIRFYAGVPLTDRHGHALGTLCVIDRKAHAFTTEQREALISLKRQFGALLELRHANAQLSAEVAARKRLEAKLRTRAESLLDLVEHAKDLVQSIGVDGRFLYVNAAWRAALGYTTEEARERNFFELVSPADRERCRGHLRAAMEGTAESEFSFRVNTRSGAELAITGGFTCRREASDVLSIRATFRPTDPAAVKATPDDEFTCMCSWCKKIREPGGTWIQLEDYLTVRHQEKLTHGICAPCSDQVLADLEAKQAPAGE